MGERRPTWYRTADGHEFNLDLNLLGRLETGGGQEGLYLRSLDALEAERLPDTDSAAMPMFSPDGSWVGFLYWQRR